MTNEQAIGRRELEARQEIRFPPRLHPRRKRPRPVPRTQPNSGGQGKHQEHQRTPRRPDEKRPPRFARKIRRRVFKSLSAHLAGLSQRKATWGSLLRRQREAASSEGRLLELFLPTQFQRNPFLLPLLDQPPQALHRQVQL